MNQEHMLILLVVFVLGFLRMMNGPLLKGSNDNGYELLG